MTLQEFAALKAGDKIANHMTSSRGTVMVADDRGVIVAWCQSTALTFHYGANSTAWMHWEKIEQANDSTWHVDGKTPNPPSET